MGQKCCCYRQPPTPPPPQVSIQTRIYNDVLLDFFDKNQLKEEHLHRLLDTIDQALAELTGEGSSASQIYENPDGLLDTAVQQMPDMLQRVADEFKTGQEQAVGTDTKNLFFTDAFGSAATRVLGEMLGKAGTIHWAACALSLVGYVLKLKQVVADNRELTLDLLRRMRSLVGDVVDLLPQFAVKEGVCDDDMLRKAVYVVATGVIVCCSSHRSHPLSRYFFANVDHDAFFEVKEKVSEVNLEITRTLSKEALKRLPRPFDTPNITLPKELVGLDEKVEKVIQEINFKGKSPAIGMVLYGMGGSGKTTLMDAVYNKIGKDKSYHGGRDPKKLGKTSHITVGETPEIPKLQRGILEHLTQRKWEFLDAKSGREHLLEEFEKCSEPLLLCIDNVLKVDHLEELLPEGLSLPLGSAILVTARNEALKKNLSRILGDSKSVLTHRVDLLSPKNSKQLLLKLIGQNLYSDATMGKYLDELVKACDGHPLALKLAGNYIKSEEGKDASWEDTIEAMRSMDGTLDGEKEDKLARCLWYAVENLDEKVRDALCDIVAFFNLSDLYGWEDVKTMVGERAFEKLEERCLVEAGEFLWEGQLKRVKVHDLVVALMKKKTDISGSRVTGWAELQPLVEDFEKLKDIKGLSLHSPRAEDIPNAAVASIQHMHSLCVLILTSVDRPLGYSAFNISTRAPLRTLIVDGCSIPPISKAKELLYLQLSDPFHTMTVEDTDRFLIHTLKAATSLKTLRLSLGKTSKTLPISFGGFTKLRVLHLDDCKSLKALPQDTGSLNQLEELTMWRCSNLEALPSSFGALTKLRVLDLDGCESLKALPQDTGSLNQLEELRMRGCSNLEALPSSFGALTKLRVLDLPGHGQLEPA